MFIGTADQFVAWLPTAMGQFEATVHAVTNLLFKVEGDKAEGEIYTTAYHRSPAPNAPPFTAQITGFVQSETE